MKLAPFDFKNENYHVGHLFLDIMRKNPDAICQIDAATDESETNASVLARSIRLARCFLKFGVKPGDVLALGGINHLDLHIPYYAALLTGMPICGVDPQFKYNQIKKVLGLAAPRIVFCQKNLLEENQKAVEELGLNAEIICFGDGDHSLAKFIDKYDDKNNTEDYVPPIFDLNKIYVWLVSTGGTTGIVKLAAMRHKNLLLKIKMMQEVFQMPDKADGGPIYSLHLSPVQWFTGFLGCIFVPLLGQIKVQSSAPHTTDHIIDIINKYKPPMVFLSPSVATSIFRGDKECDLSYADVVSLGGGKVYRDLLLELKKRLKPGALIIEGYGQTENMGLVLAPQPFGPLGNCGKASPAIAEVKLLDPETGKEITEPNVQGELWTKGVSFTEYYRNPEDTAKTFTEDGWLKTGDILYRDEEGYFFFVERLSMLIKYRSYHVVPVELEALIRENHPGVKDVGVTSIPHVEDGEHAVACVVRRTGCDVTASEIKEIIATHLSDSQKLRGGVVFMDELPMTSSGKVARGKLREIVRTAQRE